jgi:hypothetical protein
MATPGQPADNPLEKKRSEFFAHLASSREPTDEQYWVKRLRAGGVALEGDAIVNVVKHAPPGDGLWYRVAVGPFSEALEAEKFCTTISRMISKYCGVMSVDTLRQYEPR